ncbi:MAG TPA: hypothetical protein VKA46_35795 [Gemmataceae bacterium]|nr:hypothetical protein [Gemmataceae bacterium]
MPVHPTDKHLPLPARKDILRRETQATTAGDLPVDQVSASAEAAVHPGAAETDDLVAIYIAAPSLDCGGALKGEAARPVLCPDKV